MINLKISPKAKKDILEIKEYISEELGNPTAPTNVLAKITKRFRDLMEFPLIGVPLSSVIKIETSYRYLVCGQYTAFSVMKMILFMWTEFYMADEILCEFSLGMLQRKKTTDYQI